MTTMPNNRTFATTSSRGLRRELPPMRLWQKAKKLGVWNPMDIDFTQDKVDWQYMSGGRRDAILRLCSLFVAGEESVTLDLLPLLLLVAQEGRIEEELYLTSFLWEEAKHVEGFCRFLDEVVQDIGDLSRYHTPSYKKMFHEELPTAMNRLLTDRSVEAQVRALVTYNMIAEGVMAETAYQGFHRSLTDNGLMPGMQQFVGYVKRDESRHIAFAIYLLSRLMAEHGDVAWNALEVRMNELLPLALASTAEFFEAYSGYDPSEIFDLHVEEFTAYATMQFMKRMDRISRSRGQTLEEVNTVANSIDEALA
jgi:ribonucleoside-diphosphate reductase beta chain